MATKQESATYEKMLARVEKIVADVGNEETALDKMVEHVEEAYDLITKMRQRLDASKEKVDALRSQFESQVEA